MTIDTFLQEITKYYYPSPNKALLKDLKKTFKNLLPSQLVKLLDEIKTKTTQNLNCPGITKIKDIAREARIDFMKKQTDYKSLCVHCKAQFDRDRYTCPECNTARSLPLNCIKCGHNFGDHKKIIKKSINHKSYYVTIPKENTCEIKLVCPKCKTGRNESIIISS